jgi:hypothetical protein
MKESIRAGQEDGSIRPGLDPHAEAMLFISHALGLAFRWTLEWEGFDFFGELRRWRDWLENRYAP